MVLSYTIDGSELKKIEVLENDILKILSLPCQSEGEVLVKKMTEFSQMLSVVKEELRCHNRVVFGTARAIHKRGEPLFLSSEFSRDTLWKTFKWTQQEMALFDFVYHDCKDIWNNFEQIYKYNVDDMCYLMFGSCLTC